VRDQREAGREFEGGQPPKQKTFRLRKTGNEGIQRIPAKTVRRAGLILLLTEKLVEAASARREYCRRRFFFNLDEHSQIDILTSGLSLAPAFPVLDQWPWEFVTRYSGVTVPDFHGVP
jgi:hypothetical protein